MEQKGVRSVCADRKGRGVIVKKWEGNLQEGRKKGAGAGGEGCMY